MPDPLAELSMLAAARGLRLRWWVRPIGNGVQIYLQTLLPERQRPVWCEALTRAPADPRKPIEALARHAVSYWGAVLATGAR